ncbi:MAG: serine/threonine protein kinase, partial [Methylococcales bacterium]|nr:serine/threonine protein kinase [Methylococcales bacterium]
MDDSDETIVPGVIRKPRPSRGEEPSQGSPIDDSDETIVPGVIRKPQPSRREEPSQWVHVQTDRHQTKGRKKQGFDDQYEIGEFLGKGGMGSVVTARDKHLGRIVAVKILHSRLRNDTALNRRFLVEAQVGAQLEHPNIVPVYSMESDDEIPRFTMRLLGSMSLKHYLHDCKEAIERGQETPSQNLPERLERFLKICDGIEYAHSRGIVHRDLKPENVVLGQHGEVYLVDWGIAKVVTAPEVDTIVEHHGTQSPTTNDPSLDYSVQVSEASNTRHGEIIGTLTYMAPEQASGAIDEHSAATDQFSLGMLLQEVITLERPRKGNEDRKLKDARKGLRLPLEVMTNGRPVRPELAAIVTTATDFLPENRYPSVEAFADDVRRFTRDEPVSVYPERFTRRLWRRLSRRPSVTLSVIFGIFSLLFLGAMVTLADRLAMQEHAEDHARLMRTLTSEVVRNSEAIDRRFSTARRLVEGLAATTRSLLLYGSSNSGPNPYGAVGRLIGTGLPPMRGLGPAEHYPVNISFTTPAFFYPPGVTQEEVGPTIARMHPLVNALQDALLNSADEQAGNWPVERQESLLRSG